MAFLLALLYLALQYLSPGQMFPDLAPYRPMQILGGICVLALLIETWGEWRFVRSHQSLALAGFTLVVGSSVALNGWLGGGLRAILDFLPSAFCFYLVGATVKTLPRLRWLVIVLLCVALYLVGMGVLSYYGYISDPRFVLTQSVSSADNTDDNVLLRMRALGILADPNDFAQFVVVLIPLCFLWWKESALRNVCTVVLPCAILGYGIYLTHSRGGAIGLATIIAMTAKRWLGNTASVVLSVGLVASMVALNFSGGRAISVSGGEDRLELWSEGLQMFKRSPLWGIGYGNFSEVTGSLTAHNSFMLCMAELGMLGYTLWLYMLLVNHYQLNLLSGPQPPDHPLFEVSTCAQSVWLAFIGFLVTSFFLSRTYTQTLYVLLGVTVSLQRVAVTENHAFPAFQAPRWMIWGAVIVAAASVVLFYAIVKLR